MNMTMAENILELLKSQRVPESSVSELTVPPRATLLQEGEVADKLYLIRSGCLRLAFNNNGKDVTFQFFFPGSLVASFDSWQGGTPSQFSIISIEKSELVSLDGEAVKTLIMSENSFRNEYVGFLESRFHTYQQLFLSRIRNSPEQRYKELLEQNPEIVRRIPQHYIASYLGITSVSLSRIRSRLGQ